MHLKRIYFISLKVGLVYTGKYCENHALKENTYIPNSQKKKKEKKRKHNLIIL